MVSSRSLDQRQAYACMALRLGETLTVAITNTPQMRLLESNVCRNYYRGHDPTIIPPNDMVAEELCKIPAVQELISDLNGAASVLNLVPALLAAIPYLLLSRVVSKKKTLLLNAIGGLLANAYLMTILHFYNTFDPRWMWLNGVFSFIGGGDLIYYTLLEALVAESVQHSSLSSFYLYSSAVALLLKVAGSAGSLTIMSMSLELPLYIGIATKMTSVPVILAFVRDPSNHMNKRNGIHFSRVPSDEPEEFEYELDVTAQTVKEEPVLTLKKLVQKRGAIHRALIPIIICSLQEVGNSFRVILPYWLSARFHWTLQETGWVTLGEMLLSAVMLSSLPHLSRAIQENSGTSSKERDWVLTYLCLSFSCLATFLLGLSWHRISAIVSIMVLTGGTAFRDAYLGYITTDLKEEEIAEVYILLSMVSLSAFSLGGFGIAGIYSMSLRIGESWETSLPLWTCSLFFAFAVIVLKRRL